MPRGFLASAMVAILLLGSAVFSQDSTRVGAQHAAPRPTVPDSVSVDTTKTVKSIPKDSLASRLNLKRTDTVTVVKHEFNHRQQIITGSVVMACLAGILAVMNNYNPR